jgi:hypothetical protein
VQLTQVVPFYPDYKHKNLGGSISRKANPPTHGALVSIQKIIVNIAMY